jgi:hypothetical protein
MTTHIGKNGSITLNGVEYKMDDKIKICRACYCARPKDQIACSTCDADDAKVDHLMRLSEFLKDDEVHYLSKANSIAFVKKKFFIPEREMAQYLNMSKTEIGRMVKLSKLDQLIKDAAIKFKTHKHVLCELAWCKDRKLQSELYHLILTGQIIKWSDLRLGLNKIKKVLN